MIKHEFTYLNKEELEKELEKTKMNIRVQKIVAEFIQEMAKALNISQSMVSKTLNNIRQKYRLYLEKSDKL